MKDIGQYGLLAIVFILTILFGVLNPVFVSPSNLINIVDQIAIIGIISVGMTVVIISGGIDLSVGSIVAFAGIASAKSLTAGVAVPFAIGICLLCGIVIGLINGIFVAYGKVPAFIATLGIMGTARGAALYVSNSESVYGLPDSFTNMVNHRIWGFSMPGISFALLSIVIWSFLKFTFWGKYIYAIGGNERAAWLSGINTKFYKLMVYVMSGFTSGIAGLMLVGKLNSAQPQAGNMYELNAIAAVVIGGASLSGGKGSILTTVLGVLILGILQNGFSILNIPSYYQQMLVGMIIIFAVLTSSQSLKNSNT